MSTFPCPQCASPVDPSQSTGKPGYGCAACGWWVSPVQWFPDEWESLRKLGTGSMGEVFHGRHRATGQEAALKCISDARAGQPAFVARFRDELRILERLVHPGVVRLVTAGIHDGRPWLALELVTGSSLREKLRGQPLGSKAAVRVARQLAEALAYVHAEGVIHGDLKPENILLDGSGDAKIADFGLSGMAEAYSTGQGPLVSRVTAAYAAPEQLRDAQRTQPSADLYALGRMLFEMLTGRLPRGQEPLSEARPGSGRRLETLVAEMLAPEPRARLGSAAEAARRLAEIAVDLDRMGFAVETQPPGAEVEVDGQAQGVAPVSLPELPEGPHSVAARAPGFHDHLEEVQLVPGRTMRLRLALAPVSCPHCGAGTASEAEALAHRESCSKAPRAAPPQRRKSSSTQVAAVPPPAADTAVSRASEAVSDRVASLVLSLVQGLEKITVATVVKLFVFVLGLQLLPQLVEKWNLGLTSTMAGVAWLALAAFVVIVDRIQRHPAGRR